MYFNAVSDILRGSRCLKAHTHNNRLRQLRKQCERYKEPTCIDINSHSWKKKQPKTRINTRCTMNFARSHSRTLLCTDTHTHTHCRVHGKSSYRIRYIYFSNHALLVDTNSTQKRNRKWSTKSLQESRLLTLRFSMLKTSSSSYSPFNIGHDDFAFSHCGKAHIKHDDNWWWNFFAQTWYIYQMRAKWEKESKIVKMLKINICWE